MGHAQCSMASPPRATVTTPATWALAPSFLGPYTDGRGKRGSWLAVDSGGHNNYFTYQGSIYGTLWYGSEPNGDVPSGARTLVNLPSVTRMRLVAGRLVEDTEGFEG